MKLENRTILVTGAALRIGRSLALATAREGANVLVHYRSSQADAESLAEEIRALGRRAHILQATFLRLDGIFQHYDLLRDYRPLPSSKGPAHGDDGHP